MSTRGTVGFRIHQNDKLMYNHSDSYPDGLGSSVVEQMRAIAKKPGLAKAMILVRDLEAVDPKVKPTEEQKMRLAPFANFGVDDGSPDNWYCLTRNLQGDLANTLKVGVFNDAKNFILDSLYCEWAYIVNFDSMKLEVYEGYQEKPHDKGRYGNMKLPKEPGRTEYYGCALVAEFDLKKLPTPSSFCKQLTAKLKELHPEDYEDE